MLNKKALSILKWVGKCKTVWCCEEDETRDFRDLLREGLLIIKPVPGDCLLRARLSERGKAFLRRMEENHGRERERGRATV